MQKTKQYLYVMAGGAIGVGLRYGLLLVTSAEVTRAPLVILFENVLGAFLLGLLTGYVLKKKIKEWPFFSFAGTGVLGSFTTFSAFATDIVFLAGNSIALSVLYASGSLIFGILAAFIGLLIGKSESK